MIHLELSLPPQWERVSSVRDTVVSAAHAVGISEDRAYNIGLVASELVENAIKYGTFATDDAVQVVVRVVNGLTRIVVTNPMDPSSEHAQRLRGALASVNGASSARDAYLSRMSELLEEPAVSGVRTTSESGLGILRVAHEGGCSIHVRFPNGTAVEVTAALRATDLDGALVA